jgi:DMSO reductase anchor subunit
MHPAFSVIIFTTVSGAGFGLLCWLGIYALFGLLPANQAFAFITLALALGAVGIGLISSTFHLGHPERAWRAFSQWRTSWLSREGVVSVVTFFPTLTFAVGWILLGRSDGIWAFSGVLMSICAAIAVICTAGIYFSLKPIPAWHNNWVLPNYLALSAMSGILLLALLATVFGYATKPMYLLALFFIAFALFCKVAYWRFIDTMPAVSTPETATGLGHLGTVSLFEAPHTSENYLMKEMGFRIARKHARKLRTISVLFGFVLPFALIVFALLPGGMVAAISCTLAVCSALIGVLTERWLFFAEAKHTVTLYYGRRLEPVGDI